MGEEDPPPNSSDKLTHTTSEDEVLAQLKRLPWQSSPGPDGVSCAIWKSTPSSAKILAKIFSTCLLNGKLPASWKMSNTILIHKLGEKSDPGNWRPISLQSTIYKVFVALMAKRLATWAILEEKISSSQKCQETFECSGWTYRMPFGSVLRISPSNCESGYQAGVSLLFNIAWRACSPSSRGAVLATHSRMARQ